MVGKVDLWAGVDKLEADFKWSSFYPDVIVTIANPFVAVALQVRGSLQNWDDSGLVSEVPVVVHMTELVETLRHTDPWGNTILLEARMALKEWAGQPAQTTGEAVAQNGQTPTGSVRSCRRRFQVNPVPQR